MKTRILHLTTVHTRTDTRIRYKQIETLSDLYPNQVILVVQDGNGDEDVNQRYKIHDIGRRPKSRFLRAVIGSMKILFVTLKLRPTIVHFHDPELIPFAMLLRLFGLKIIYDVHEDLPKQILSKDYIKPIYLRKIVSGLASVIEAVAGILFSRIIVTTTKIEDRFPKHKTALVRNYPKLEILSANGIGKKSRTHFVISYAGSLTKSRGIIDLVNAMEFLPDTYKMQFLGSFQPPRLEGECKALEGWQKCEYLGRVPHSQIGEYISSAHLGVQMMHDIPNYTGGIATKIFEYLAVGVPTLMSDTPERRSNYHSLTLFAEPANPEDIASKIRYIRNNYTNVLEQAKINQAFVLEKMTWKNEGQKLADVYAELLKKPT